MQKITTTRNISFRLVTQADSDFILQLRLNERKNKYLSSVENDMRKQQLWLEDYKAREQKGLEYYYIIQDKTGEDIGLVRLYDFHGDTCTWGSWQLVENAPLYAAIESALLIHEIAFCRLNFKKCKGAIMKGNDSVLKFHLNYGFQMTHEDHTFYHLYLDHNAFEETKRKYRRFLK